MEVFLVLVLLFFYAFFKKKNILKSLLVVLVGYAIFFIFGVLPSIVGIVLGVFAEGGVMMVREFDIAALFMSPYEFFGIKGKEITSFLPRKMSAIYLLLIFASIAVFQYRNSKQKFFALLKNTRPLQAVYNLGLLFIGLGLGLFNYGENFQLDFFSILTLLNLMLVVFSAWYFSVFVNDYFDCQIDKISNKERPLVSGVFSKKEFVDISLVFLLLSLVAALVINPLFFWLVLFYHVLTWIYSAPPFRLKRFFVFSNLIIAAASVLFIFIGFLVFSGEELFKAFPWSLAGFFFLAYFFILPIKDFKDIKGDKKNGVYTLPVLIGEELARLFLASALFVFYFLSVYIVNEPGMFLPALVFGSASFFVVASKKTETRKMGSRVFALVFLYGLLSVWIIFS